MSQKIAGSHTGDGDSLLTGPRTRRNFLKGIGAGATVTMLPGLFSACSSGGIPIEPPGPGGGIIPTPVAGLTFDLRTDIGIFRLVDALEQLEGAFYTAVVANSNFNSFFNADEREVLVDIRDAEIIHREVVRAGLGSNRLPDLTGSINMPALNAVLASKAGILTMARSFEHTGVAGLNGAGKYLQDTRNLLFAGKLASVEARHVAALRDISPPTGTNPNTAFAGDDVVNAMGLDVKLEAGEVIARVVATNLLLPNTIAANPISNPPTATQGVATPSFFPANP